MKATSRSKDARQAHGHTVAGRVAAITRRQFLTQAVATGTVVGSTYVSTSFAPRRAHAAPPSLKGSGSVVVYDGGGAWGAAQRAAYYDPFEAASGIKVIPNPQAPAAKIQAGIQAGAPGYDVISLTGGDMQALIDAKVLVPIDYKWFDQEDIGAFAPVKPHEYHVPALFYSLVLAYDPRKFSATPPKTWADFWDTKRYPGPRALGTGAWGPSACTFEVALLADGVAPNRLYPLDIERAVTSLTRIKPALLKFWESGAEGPQLLNDGQVVLTAAWNGRVADLQAKGGQIANSWEQGILQWDTWGVPKGAKNIENAMKFLAFASQARSQAKFAELITYGPTNAGAYKYLRPERAALLPTSPALRAQQIVQDYGWWASKAPGGKAYAEYVVERWEKWLTTGK